MGALRTRSRASVTSEHAVRKPNFFIIGAPKCGTTSLYTYLAAHPQIFMPRIKEPFFFCSDFPGYRERSTLITDMNKYLNLFEGATPKHLVCGEASVLYLLSEVAVPEILTFNPQARFIVMLRNPLDLVYSMHSQVLGGLNESICCFEQAWRMQDDRAQGRDIPKSCLDPAVLQYRELGMLGKQVHRLLAHVSKERVKFLLLDDMAKDPGGVYEEALAFLEVPSDRRTVFTKENTNRTHRSRRLAQLITTPPYPLNWLRDQYRRHVGIRTWPAVMISSLNSKKSSRRPLTPEFRRELKTEFYDDVRLLERLIDRDLSHWIAPKPRSRQSAPQAA